jgi:hypothetical protein
MDEDIETRLTDAYDRLGTALAPPPDLVSRVEGEVGARRRRRRTAWAGTAALVLAGAAGSVAVIGSGHGPDGDNVAVDPPGASGKPATVDHGSLVLTRADGSTQEFPQLTVSCEVGPRGEKVAPGRIMLYSPYDPADDGTSLKSPLLTFEADVTKAAGSTFALPDDRGGAPDEVFVLFVADPGPADPVGAAPERANEVSSAQPGAAGTVKVLKASCGPDPVLELEVDATLGSEVGQGTEALAGSYH